MEVVFTKLHAGGKFGGGGYSVSGGLHGVGVSVVNALSTKVEVEVHREGHVWRQDYRHGVPTAPLAKGEASDRTGTTVTFWADGEIFETLDYDFSVLTRRFQEMAFLNKGLTINIVDERITSQDSDGNPRKETYCYEGGISDFVKHINHTKGSAHPSIINFGGEDQERGISVDVALQWNESYSESVYTFANTINTIEGGTHEEGFRAAITSLLNKYARQVNLLKEKDENLSGDDCREGLTAVISVKLSEPQFEGQTKTKLGNTEEAFNVISPSQQRLSYTQHALCAT